MPEQRPPVVRHWHILVRDGRRTRGALATTWEATEAERDIENQISSVRNAQPVECTEPCFGSRLQSS